VLYVGSLAGLIPAAPGHSHQSLRDISALTSVPNLDIVEPCCPEEVPLLLDYLLSSKRSGYLRLISVPWAVPFAYPAKRLVEGQGVVLWESPKPAVAIVTYGLIMTAEAYKAAEELADEGFDSLVIECPFLNRINGSWFGEKVKFAKLLVTIDNHYVNGGFGDQLLSALARAGVELPPRVVRLGIDDVPASGQPAEVLKHHGLDSASLKDRIRQEFKG
jgi:transketolase